jgi:hypothetical protein
LDLRLPEVSRVLCLPYVPRGTPFVTLPRELAQKERRKKGTIFCTEMVDRRDREGRRVSTESCSRILLRPPDVKPRASKRHFASVYARTFYPGCKNICEFPWRLPFRACTFAYCSPFPSAFIHRASWRAASRFLSPGTPPFAFYPFRTSSSFLAIKCSLYTASENMISR